MAPPPPPSPVSKVDGRHTGRLRKRDNFLGEGNVKEAKSYDCEKAFYSIMNQIISGVDCSTRSPPGKVTVVVTFRVVTMLPSDHVYLNYEMLFLLVLLF